MLLSLLSSLFKLQTCSFIKFNFQPLAICFPFFPYQTKETFNTCSLLLGRIIIYYDHITPQLSNINQTELQFSPWQYFLCHFSTSSEVFQVSLDLRTILGCFLLLLLEISRTKTFFLSSLTRKQNPPFHIHSAFESKYGIACFKSIF